jgi:3-oxoacyl-[acyl-carrier protein] reductase
VPKAHEAGRLAGKVAVVTGAGRGLGRVEALALAAHGAKVVVNDLGADELGQGAESSVAEAVVREIKSMGGYAVANGDNVAHMAGGQRIIEAALDTFGRLDILVNNAGIVRPKVIWEMSEVEWDAVIAVHLKGHFTTVRHAAPIFCKQHSGVILNTASESGLGHYAMSNYSAAKEGIIGFTRAIARDLGRFNVRCNAMRPRGITRMAIPEVIETIRYSQEVLGIAAHGDRWVSGLGETPPENVAQFVVWICSDSAANVNGRDFFVGGGTVSLYSEPDRERSVYREGGWTPDELDKDEVREYLVGNLENNFLGRKS